VESRLGKPSLIRETSRVTPTMWLRQPVQTAQRLLGSGSTNGTSALDGIVLESNLEGQLGMIATSTANTKKNRAPFRHLLLHGMFLPLPFTQ
jgi:ATPase family AAA domain-containing protein 3A/B